MPNLQSTLKVRQRGLWIYKEKEYVLELPLKIEPWQVENIVDFFVVFWGSKTEGSSLKQIGGALADGDCLCRLSLLDNLEKSPVKHGYSINTQFKEYRDLSVYNERRIFSDLGFIKFFGLNQIVRQVGYVFSSLEVGIRFYSSSSKISQWFRVPVDEATLNLYLSNNQIKTKVVLRSSCGEETRNFIREYFLSLSRALGFEIKEFTSLL